MKVVVQSLLFGLLTVCISFAQVDDKPVSKQPEAPKLGPVFSDDFSTDTRSDYRIEGDVSWQPGQLTLNEGTSVERDINGGPWAKVELDLEWPGRKEDTNLSELRVWFVLDGASNCFVRLRAESKDGNSVLAVALVDTGEQDGKPVEQTIRETTLSTSSPERLAIEYRHGLVMVAAGNESLWAAHIENGAATCAALRLQSTVLTTRLTRFASATEKQQAVSLTAGEKKLLAAAERATKKMFQLYRAGEFVEATKIGEQVLEIRKRIRGEEHPHYASSLNNLALLYKSMGEYARAEPLFVQARDIRKKVLGEEHPSYAQSLQNLASLYDSMGDYARAEPLLVQARDIRKTVLGEEHPDYAQSLNNLALLYSARGEYARAEPLFGQARDIRKKVLGEEHPSYAGSLNNLAFIYQSMGESGRAESLYVQARDIHKKVLGGEHPLYATILSNLAELYRSMGEYGRAEALYVQARDIRKKMLGEEHPDYATSLNNLAELYRSMGEFARAEPLFAQALDIDKKVLGEEHPNFATSLNNLALIYMAMGEYARAEPLLVQARDIRKKAFGEEHPDYASSLNNLAFIYNSMGESARAEPLYVQARDIQKKVLCEEHPAYALSLSNLAGLYQSIADHAQAEPLFWAAFRAQLDVTAGSLDSMSEAQALSWMQSNGPRMDLVLGNLRRLDRADLSMAYQAVWQTKSVISRLRTSQSLDKGAPQEVQEVFGRLRDARLRLAKLVSATPKPDQAEGYRQALAEASEAKEGLEKELASINPATQRALAIRDASIEQLVSRLPAGVAVIDFVQVYDSDFVDHEITLKNEDGSAETRTVKKRQTTPVYDAFVLRADRQTEAAWIQLGQAAPINTAVAQWRGQLTGDGTDRSLGNELIPAGGSADADPASVLRQLVWFKLAPHMDGCHTVIILPDGALNGVPWAALPGRKPGSYLIEDYAVATANYGQQLFGLLSDATPVGDRLLVAGGIRYDKKRVTAQANANQLVSRPIEVSKEDRNWSYLKGAEQEATAVSAMWQDRGERISLSGIEAGEDSVSDRLEHSRYAHLATHGFFDTAADVYRVNLREQSLFETGMSGSRRGATVAARSPLLMTGIVLAGANVEPEKNDLGLPVGSDGILTAEEIVGLDLRNLELVTLSACETGLGDVAAGEGVFGLQRALHQAGARSVVASLWKVSDKATKALMVEFYKNLWDKKMSKIESLRQAQLTMINRYQLETGQLRGIGNQTVKAGAKASKVRLDPRYWAAFQLSGDWR